MDAAKLTRTLAKAPHQPGVYFWRSRSGRPLYIGKASDLRNRLSNYRRPSDRRIALMVRTAAKLDWQETGTEIEALIREAALIKRYRPKFNIEFRDSKQYFLVAITDEPFPHFILTHQHRSAKLKRPVKEFIGPFTEGIPLKTTLRILRSLFPYCSCTQTHHVKCLNAHLGLCPGYCCLKTPATAVQKRAYAANVRAIRDILTGKRDAVIRRMEKRMSALGKSGHLEEALAMQRRIARLRRVFEHARVSARLQALAARHEGALRATADLLGMADVPRRIEGYDVANIQGEHAVGALAVFTDGTADPSQYRLFNMREQVTGDVPMLRQMAQRRLRHREWPLPDLVVVDGGKGQYNALTKLFGSIPVIAVQKDARHRPAFLLSARHDVPMPFAELPKSVRDLLAHVDEEAHRFSISRYRRRQRRTVAPLKRRAGSARMVPVR